MKAKKPPTKKPRPKLFQPVARLAAPLRGRGRHVILAVGLVVGFIVAANILWQRYSPRILADSRYQISVETVETTPPPAWIKSDVKAEVLRGSSLSDLRIFDKQVVTKIADAFTVHPWVAQVVGVRKQPEKVFVQLEYRRPVSFVEVTVGGQPGLVPVDAKGVLLPSVDFTKEDANGYLRIGIADLTMNGSLGTTWRDNRVVEAAQIAAAWQPQRDVIDLYRIVGPPVSVPGNTIYVLETRRGDQIVWGRPPGQESAAEANAADKIAQLVAYVQRNEAFASAAAPVHVDIRSGTVRSIPTKSARHETR